MQSRSERHGLRLSTPQLQELRRCVDSALHVKRARSAADRKKAIGALRGRALHSDALSKGSAIRAQRLEPRLKKKRPSGASNWPKTPAERVALQARLPNRPRMSMAEWRASRLLPMDSSEVEPAVLREVRAKVATLLRVPLDRVPPPDATVWMLDSRSDWIADTADGIQVSVSLHDHTQPPQLADRAASSAPMAAAEALVYRTATPHRFPEGDWRRMLTFRLLS
jgi:hypothetical protein